MSRVTRRTLLKGSATLGAVAAVPMSSGTAQPASRLVVFDSAIAESRGFAADMQRGHQLDLASEHQGGWKQLRAGLPPVEQIEGLTGWSDLVAVRSEFEARGLRLESQRPVAAPLSGKAHLFRWSMKAR